MAKPRKGKIKVRQKFGLRKKGEAVNDAIPQAPARLYRDTGANLKVKIRRK